MSGHNHPSNPEWHPTKFLATALTAYSGLAEHNEGVIPVFALSFVDVDGNKLEVMFEPALAEHIVKGMLHCQLGRLRQNMAIAQQRREWNGRNK